MPEVFRESGIRTNSPFYHIGDGFQYNFNRVNSSATRIYFICNRGGCGGRAVWVINEQFFHTQAHNHPADLPYLELRQQRRAIIDRARSVRHVSFRDIVDEGRRGMQNRDIRGLLTYRRLRSALHRARASIFPNVPQNLAQLTAILQDPAWQHLCQTNDLQDSIYCGSAVGEDGSHNILFISSRSLQTLREALVIFADGTFYIAPAIDNCYQVFTIVLIVNHTVIAVAWCLMERKSEAAYIAVFLLLRAKLVTWNFIKVICDFEDGMMKAFRIVFAVQVQGCLFHCVNAMVGYARDHLTVGFLNAFPAARVIVELCCALPLLPQLLLQRGMNVIWIQAQYLGPLVFPVLNIFLDYVQREWLNHVNRGSTMSVCGCEFRTNNASESNNKRMKRVIAVHSPNVFQLIRHFINFEDTSLDDLNSIFGGDIPSRERAGRAVSNDRHVAEITRNLLVQPFVTDQHIIDFLLAASSSVRGAVNDVLHPQRRQRD